MLLFGSWWPLCISVFFPGHLVLTDAQILACCELVPCNFYFLMMDSAFQCSGVSSNPIFLYPSPDVYLSETLSESCFGRSLEPMLLPLSGSAFENGRLIVNSCFYSSCQGSVEKICVEKKNE